MATSATDREFLNYFTQLNTEQKKSLLELVKSFLKSGPELTQPQSLEEYNHELEAAQQRVAQGEYTTVEDLEREMKTW